MSEQRRATLTPFGKSDKNLSKSPRNTFRFNFTLSDPSEDSCPVFDYGSVVKREERKLLKKKHEEKEKKPNGVLDPFNEDDDDVKRIAHKFEEKYGGKKKKCMSYAELGAGYDETDPFIDNTEACDEELQEDQETACGGYYINSGPLELKRVELSDQSDADEVAKRRQKRGLPVIEEDEEEEEEAVGEAAEVEEAVVEAETKPVPPEEGPPEAKKAKVLDEVEEPEDKPSSDLEESNKKKKKRLQEDISNSVALNKAKKAKTVKALLEEKRVQEVVPEEHKKQIASITSISEAIESVVNAGHNDDNSNSSRSSHTATASTSASEDSQDGKSSSQIVPPPLPDDLGAELEYMVGHIKRTAAVTENTRKTFCPEINNTLVKLEWRIREFHNMKRNHLFAHLACYLPCTKDTLMRRAKKLFVHKEESQIETIICKLKATIDVAMPSLQEKYAKECQRIAEEKGIPVTPSNGTPGGENQVSPDSISAKMPKKKFPWTDETRMYLREIVRLKNRCFKVLKPRKSRNDEYVKSFLQNKIRTLWPHGWMRTSVLLKESCRSPANSGKSKHSSSFRPSNNDLSRLNASYPSPSPSNTSHSLYVSPIADTPHQPMKSPLDGSTPHAAKNSANPLNLLTKITSSINTSPKKSFSPGHQQNSKTEKPESFSMDSLLKRTSESMNCNDYNTTLSDIMKKENVIMNGLSLPLKNVNSSQVNDSGKNEKILDLSSCNSSIEGTPSVMQSVTTNERTTMRASDSVSLSANPLEKHHASTPSPSRREASSNLPLNRKQRLLQLSTQSSCDKMVDKKTDSDTKVSRAAHKSTGPIKGEERRMSEETTTATDILSQIISESLLSPPQPPSSMPLPYITKSVEEGKPQSTGRDSLYDAVMKDLKELNHISGGTPHDMNDTVKNNSFEETPWGQFFDGSNKNHYPGIINPSKFHNEFVKHLLNRQESPSSSTLLKRHSASPYDNSQSYVNDISKSVYNSTPNRPVQSMSSAASKVSQVNQGCIMKSLPTTGISTGNESQPHQ